MDIDPALRDDVVRSLRTAGASFALGFRESGPGTNTNLSDLDVAAWWPRDPPTPWSVAVPDNVDLIVIHDLPLELAGRIALAGVVILDDDPAARVRWVADTRKIWLDERPRFEAAHRTFLEAAARGR